MIHSHSIFFPNIYSSRFSYLYSAHHLTIVDTKTSFEGVCRTEKNVKVKERMLLVLNVVYYGKIASQVARTLHKSKGWASQWLKRYRDEGIEGLKDRPKIGRRPELPPEVEYEIRGI